MIFNLTKFNSFATPCPLFDVYRRFSIQNVWLKIEHKVKYWRKCCENVFVFLLLFWDQPHCDLPHILGFVCLWAYFFFLFLTPYVLYGNKHFYKHLKDPPAMAAPNGYQSALSVPLQPNHTINTINSNSWHPLGYIPSEYRSDRDFSKSFCFQWNFFD